MLKLLEFTPTFYPNMPDRFSKEKRSQIMSKIKGRGNERTELAMARLLRHNKITGWRRHQPLTGKPDFTFYEYKTVLFVDGCFWHRCPKHSNMPKTNRAYWNKKLRGNEIHDRTVTRQLKKEGWAILRVWEHELRNPDKVAIRIRETLDLSN
jgi:DNA mismatch endonuclease, patch repair protein